MMVVQMHGEPGSGKSTSARAIGRALPAVVVDKDSIASVLLGAGMAPLVASGTAYDVMRSIGADLLAAGHHLVLDSPCYWPQIEEQGRALAARFGARWLMVECRCAADEVERRLATRGAKAGQPTTRDSVTPRPGMYAVSCERLVLDSSRPLEESVSEAVAYLRALTPDRSPVGGRGAARLGAVAASGREVVS